MLKPDATILGAGLMGRLLACALAQRGHRVEVIDAGGPEAAHAAARVAAAMLAPLAESAVTELNVVRMGQHALARWPQLLATLEHPVFFQQAGHAGALAPPGRGRGRALRRPARAHQRRPALAAAGAAHGRRRPHRAGALRWPTASRKACTCPTKASSTTASCSPRWRTRCRCWASRCAGTRRATPDEVDPGPDAWLFDCRGLGGQPQWGALRGVRGEVARILAPGVSLSRPTRLVHPRYPLYIAPKPEGVFVIGATEIESDDLSPASVRSTLELLSAAYTVHPGFGEARIIELGVQLRPTLPDNLPALRLTGPRRMAINGLYRHGFMIAPAVLDAALEAGGTGPLTAGR